MDIEPTFRRLRALILTCKYTYVLPSLYSNNCQCSTTQQPWPLLHPMQSKQMSFSVHILYLNGIRSTVDRHRKTTYIDDLKCFASGSSATTLNTCMVPDTTTATTTPGMEYSNQNGAPRVPTSAT